MTERHIHSLALGPLLVVLALVSACSGQPAVDPEFPQDNPVVADSAATESPSDGPADAQADQIGDQGEQGRDGTNYALLTILALCLIGAGMLLVRVEKWQRHRSHNPDPG